MLTEEQLTKIADDLAEAEAKRTMIPRLTATYPDMTVEDSYAVPNVAGSGRGRRSPPDRP